MEYVCWCMAPPVKKELSGQLCSDRVYATLYDLSLSHYDVVVALSSTSAEVCLPKLHIPIFSDKAILPPWSTAVNAILKLETLEHISEQIMFNLMPHETNETTKALRQAKTECSFGQMH